MRSYSLVHLSQLCSRKSFFGSSLSTAGASISDKYVPAAQVKEAEQAEKFARQLEKQARAQRLPSAPVVQQIIAPLPKKAKVDYSAFLSLADDQPGQVSDYSSLWNPCMASWLAIRAVRTWRKLTATSYIISENFVMSWQMYELHDG